MDTRIYCPICGDYEKVIIKKENETYPVKNEQIEILADITYCEHCGNQVWNDESDDNNLKIAYNEYRNKHGLLLPVEIKEIRDKYNISQSALAKILGFGEKTITRYENGSLQDKAQNNLLTLVGKPDIFAYLLEQNKNELSAVEYEKASEALESLKPKIVTCTSANIKYSNQVNYPMKSQPNVYFGGLSNVI